MSTFFWHPKRQSFYHRTIVPRRLRPFLNGRAQYWRSLRTEEKDKAKERSAQWDARCQLVFATLKVKGEYMTKAEIEALVARWLETELDEAEDFRATCGPKCEDEREGIRYALSDMFDNAEEALVNCDYRAVEHEADELLKSGGLPLLDHEGVAFGRLCRSLLMAKQEYTRIEADRWEGVYTDVFADRPVGGSTTRQQQQSLPAPPGKPFSEVVKLYFQENPKV